MAYHELLVWMDKSNKKKANHDEVIGFNPG
jgi:hypothetical protein